MSKITALTIEDGNKRLCFNWGQCDDVELVYLSYQDSGDYNKNGSVTIPRDIFDKLISVFAWDRN